MRDFLWPAQRRRLEALGWEAFSQELEKGERAPISWLLTQLEKARAAKPAPTIERIDTVRRALREAAIVSRAECRDMKAVDVADQTLNRLIEGEFDEPK